MRSPKHFTLKAGTAVQPWGRADQGAIIVPCDVCLEAEWELCPDEDSGGNVWYFPVFTVRDNAHHIQAFEVFSLRAAVYTWAARARDQLGWEGQ